MTIDHATRQPADPPTPVYQHDSECCVFIRGGMASGVYCDFYHCPKTGSLLARWGDDGPRYNSVYTGHDPGTLGRIVRSFDGLMGAYMAAGVIDNVLDIDCGEEI
jgi:hypothetical protein